MKTILKSLHLMMLVLPLMLTAQQATSFNEQLDKVFAYAHKYRQDLPGYECRETFVSQQLRGETVTREVHVVAHLREIRKDESSDEFTDHYEFESVDGQLPKEHFKLPYFVKGVFSNSLGMGGRPRPHCVNYQFTSPDNGRTIRLSIDERIDRPATECIDLPNDYHKVVLIDAASGAISRVERSINPDWAKKHMDIPWLAVDFAPQKLGEETYWLPIRFEARDEKRKTRIIGSYSDIHLYTGKGKILPDSMVPETPSE